MDGGRHGTRGQIKWETGGAFAFIFLDASIPIAMGRIDLASVWFRLRFHFQGKGWHS